MGNNKNLKNTAFSRTSHHEIKNAIMNQVLKHEADHRN